MLYSDYAPTTRTRTPEGMLRASAIITRTGVFEYSGSDFGYSDKPIVRVNRTRESVSAPDTLASIRGAPVTLDHPANGTDVSPTTWQTQVVGNVVGEPTIDKDGYVRADILIGRQDAISAIEAGTHELSIGYDFAVIPAAANNDYDLLTDGAIRVNHVAVVKSGRAGGKVRILDSGNPQEKERAVPNDEIKKYIDEAIGGIVEKLQGANKQETASTVAAGYTDMAAKIREIDERQRKQAADAEQEKAVAKAKEAAAEFEKKIRAETDAHWKTRTHVMTMLSDEQRKEFEGKGSDEVSEKALLVAALKDTLPNAENMGEAELRGALAFAKATKSTDAGGNSDGKDWRKIAMDARGQPKGEAILPSGIGVAKAGVQDKAAEARNQYISDMTNAYKGETKGAS